MRRSWVPVAIALAIVALAALAGAWMTSIKNDEIRRCEIQGGQVVELGQFRILCVEPDGRIISIS